MQIKNKHFAFFLDADQENGTLTNGYVTQTGCRLSVTGKLLSPFTTRQSLIHQHLLTPEHLLFQPAQRFRRKPEVGSNML